MEAARFVEALERDLAQVAGFGDETTAAAAERLAVALRSAVGIRLLEALTEAALEVSAQLPGGHVEVRLAGQDPALVFVEEAEQPAAGPAADDDASARISLRLPESVKAAVEQAAARESLSVNSWIVRALARAIANPPSRGPGRRLTGFAES